MSVTGLVALSEASLDCIEYQAPCLVNMQYISFIYDRSTCDYPHAPLHN